MPTTQGIDVILLREEKWPTLRQDIRQVLLQREYDLPESVKELLFAAYAKAK